MKHAVDGSGKLKCPIDHEYVDTWQCTKCPHFESIKKDGKYIKEIECNFAIHSDGEGFQQDLDYEHVFGRALIWALVLISAFILIMFSYSV